jgi:RHS repeat-associated protein
VQNPEGKKKPLVEEYMDLDGDGDGFDSGDLEVAYQAYWNDEPAGGPKKVWKYYLKDHLGGTTHTVDSRGSVVSHQQYHPYGKTAYRDGARPTYGFAGSEIEEEEELGLVQFGARWYASEIGRWVSADPLFYESAKANVAAPIESGLYSYSSNSPTVFVDPTGTETVEEMIDKGGESAAKMATSSESSTIEKVAGYGLTALAATGKALWTVFGQESISKVSDHAVQKIGGGSGRSDMSSGDYTAAGVDAALEVVPGGKILKAGGKLAKLGVQAGKEALEAGVKGGKKAAEAINDGRKAVGGVSPRAARRQAMREAGIPTSQQPVRQTSVHAPGDQAAGRQYSYEVPAEGGGTQTMSVQHSLTDRVSGHGPHWEAGPVKPGGQTDSLGRPRLTSDKVKIDE